MRLVLMAYHRIYYESLVIADEIGDEKEMIQTKYSKLVVARYHPENNCNVDEGAILTVVPKSNVKMKGQIAHFFIDAKNKKTKSRYGWVRTVDPFDLQDFLSTYQPDANSEEEIEHIKAMLDSVNKLADDLPVAATYSQRGVEEKKMVFTVHRVFFY